MTSAQVVETPVNSISNSPSQAACTHPDDRTLLNYDTFIIVQQQLWGDFVPATCSIMGHITGTKSPQNWCCTIIKVSAHTRGHVTATRPWDMYLQHFHVCAHVVISSPLHFPATCRLSVHYTSFLSLQHVAVTCPCNTSYYMLLAQG